MTHSLNQQNVSDPDNFQLKVSGEELQSSIATLSSTVAGVQQSLTALTQANSYLPTVGPASFTGNLQVESLKITHVLLTPYLLAPTEYVDMNIRNYGNFGGLSISNATGAVHIAAELTVGTTGSIAEVTTGGVRALRFVHDIGTNFVCGQSTVLSLEASTGATVSALSVSGNCTVGSLVVSGTNILAALDELTQKAASTAPIAVSDVVGLSTALAGKQAILSAASALQLDSLTCSRLKPATGQDLQLSASCSWG